ncbi:hypothetical protein R5M92_05935 [Halomonas sp. Bachu 37]|uniref:hypothetical protein n=1 Tax=Halomonas kashgarensis TaxID=3084920 RepID=UPI003216CF24
MSEMMLSPEMLGYFTEDDLQDIPDDSGVYCVFSAAEDTSSGEMDVKSLLFIGHHRNLRHAIMHHEDKAKWRDRLKEGEELWFSAALCSLANCERLEAALVYAHKPPLNRRYVDTFPFDQTVVHVMGKKRLLMNPFTVERHEA